MLRDLERLNEILKIGELSESLWKLGFCKKGEVLERRGIDFRRLRAKLEINGMVLRDIDLSIRVGTVGEFLSRLVSKRAFFSKGDELVVSALISEMGRKGVDGFLKVGELIEIANLCEKAGAEKVKEAVFEMLKDNSVRVNVVGSLLEKIKGQEDFERFVKENNLDGADVRSVLIRKSLVESLLDRGIAVVDTFERGSVLNLRSSSEVKIDLSELAKSLGVVVGRRSSVGRRKGIIDGSLLAEAFCADVFGESMFFKSYGYAKERSKKEGVK